MSAAVGHAPAIARWAGLGVAVALAGWVLGGAGLPSSHLFGALLLGLVVALWWPGRMAVSRRAFAIGQMVAGVGIGAFVEPGALSALGADWLPVVVITLATVGIGIAIGAALARMTTMDVPTGTLGMVAGGASGIVSMTGELGGDERIVAFMQYLRVLFVITLTPLLVVLVLSSSGTAGTEGAGDPFLGAPLDWLVVLAVAVLGTLGGHLLRLPAPALLGPLILAAVLSAAAPFGALNVPPALLAAAFGLIGLQVGLGFTLEAIHRIRRLLAPILAGLAALFLGCFGLAVLLDLTTSASLLDAYLAMTPGGLLAVTAAAFDTGANATFVVSVQGLRLLAMVLLAPVAVRLAHLLAARLGGRSAQPAPAPTHVPQASAPSSRRPVIRS